MERGEYLLNCDFFYYIFQKEINICRVMMFYFFEMNGFCQDVVNMNIL